MSLSKLSLSAALAAAFAGALLAAAPVSAADLDPALEDPVQVLPSLPSLPTSNVVFGSGWYVRGDIGGAQLYQANPFYQHILNRNPATQFYSDAPGVSLERSHQFGYLADLGAGYAFTPYLRADAVFDYHQPINSAAYGKPFACQNGFSATGAATYSTCSGLYQANVSSYDALVNGYLDLGTWWSVTPYIGAGVGLSFGHYSTASSYYQADGTSYNINVNDPANGQSYHLDFDRSASGTYYNVAYALMAGFAFPIYAHTQIDVGYRYLNLGKVLGTNYYTQEVRAGLRYMIDN